MTETQAVAVFAVAWFGGWLLAARWHQREAAALERRDVRDRSKLRELWRLHDRDGREALGKRALAVLCVVVAVGLPAWLFPGWAVAVCVVGGLVLIVRHGPRFGGEVLWAPEYDEYGREVICYAFGGYGHFDGAIRDIKYGVTGRDELTRMAEVAEDERLAEWRVLAYGAGGKTRENDILGRLADWRYPSGEFFDPTPEVIAVIGEFETITDEGMRLLREYEVAA